MLQLSRLFIGGIEETIRELYIAHDTFARMKGAPFPGDSSDITKDLEKISIEWMKLIESRESKLNVLLDRLRRKKEEIQSLRDGVSALVNEV
jgi:hypothetical protein